MLGAALASGKGEQRCEDGAAGDKGEGRRQKGETGREKRQDAFSLLPYPFFLDSRRRYGSATMLRLTAPLSTRDSATVRLASSKSSCSMPFIAVTVS